MLGKPNNSCNLHNGRRDNMTPVIEKKWGTRQLCKLTQGPTVTKCKIGI